MSLHTDKKLKDSSNVRPAQQPKPKKKSPAQVARGRARRKKYRKRTKSARQLSAENLTLHYQLLGTETVPSQSTGPFGQPARAREFRLLRSYI